MRRPTRADAEQGNQGLTVMQFKELLHQESNAPRRSAIHELRRGQERILGEGEWQFEEAQR